MQILLAEDDRVSCELMRRIIESDAPHRVKLAKDGDEAWKLLSDETERFDVCVFDICMPSIGGLDIVERMRASDRLRHTPVILCSAVHDRVTVQRAASLNVTHYVMKPYSRTLMLDKLRAVKDAIACGDMLEPSAVVCKRLGIETDTHRVMLDGLLKDVGEWGRQLGTAPDGAEVQKLFIRGQGYRGSCLNLGARSLAQRLNTTETVIQKFLGQPAPETPPAVPTDVFAGEIEGIEREVRLIRERLSVAA